MGLLFSRRRVPSCRKHASHTGERRLRRPCVRCLAPLGQGALPVCVFDAVCPCGAKALQRGAPDFGRFTGKSFLRGVLPIRKLSRRAGKRSCGAHLIAFAFRGEYPGRGIRSRPFFPFYLLFAPAKGHLPALPAASSPTIPRGERRALPAPAQGANPLGIPFWGMATVSPAAPVPQPPQAASPCSWGGRASNPSQRHRPAALPPLDFWGVLL